MGYITAEGLQETRAADDLELVAAILHRQVYHRLRGDNSRIVSARVGRKDAHNELGGGGLSNLASGALDLAPLR